MKVRSFLLNHCSYLHYNSSRVHVQYMSIIVIWCSRTNIHLRLISCPLSIQNISSTCILRALAAQRFNNCSMSHKHTSLLSYGTFFKTSNYCISNDPVSESKAEIHGALWRIPPVDDTEPPGLDSPGISLGSGYSRSLQLICNFDNKHENMRRLVHTM